MGNDEVNVPLASAIQALRGELVAAVHEGQDEEVKFALGPIDLEFQVEVSREAGADAGVRFWVVAIGGKGSRSSATTHTVKVSLTPVLASEASDDRPLVVGSEQLSRPD
jgi:hypothetical protein